MDTPAYKIEASRCIRAGRARIALRRTGRMSLKRPAAGGESCKRDSFSLYRKDRLWRSAELKIARTKAGMTNKRLSV